MDVHVTRFSTVPTEFPKRPIPLPVVTVRIMVITRLIPSRNKILTTTGPNSNDRNSTTVRALHLLSIYKSGHDNLPSIFRHHWVRGGSSSPPPHCRNGVYSPYLPVYNISLLGM
jgi:hypothetical protein